MCYGGTRFGNSGAPQPSTAAHPIYLGVQNRIRKRAPQCLAKGHTVQLLPSMSAADDMSGWLESVGLNPTQTAGTKAHFDYLGVSEPSDLIRLKPTEVEGLNLPLAEKYKLLNAIKAVDLLVRT